MPNRRRSIQGINPIVARVSCQDGQDDAERRAPPMPGNLSAGDRIEGRDRRLSQKDTIFGRFRTLSAISFT
jgi:hypothetical protein